ncbi:PAS domain S-box protein [Methylobacterium gossipiicola]|uniref:Blue-light-activated histidine kinase n=1 Tax=Methylobacterium gossipiicola TaxID=582675 RepID=A0A1I2RS77_9HYPH|nr:PAS domain S-box protein [Methylobacterium gossipiicola]SFG43514.1 PAS domain S-box-containing protein [Methylobacterium gossipiicola]
MSSHDDDAAAHQREAEARRAALALYDILDTPAEAVFDDLVRAASLVLNAPVSIVVLVEEQRQYFKAAVGFEGPEPPLAHSFCAHAVRQHDLLVIPDATRDPRTVNSPLVTGPPFLRFYAGMPLVTPEGVAIGTLCVLDTAPRALTDDQTFILTTLARQVMAQLDLRRALKERRTRERRNAAILESAVDYGIFATDLAGCVTSWNTGARHLFGWSEAEMLGRSADRVFVPEDRILGTPAREMETARTLGRANDERWHLRQNGSRFWASGEMMPLRGEDGAHEGYLKILCDRTAQRRADEAMRQQTALLQTVTDHLGEAVFRLSLDGAITFANPAAEAMLGWAEGDLIGRNLHAIAHHRHPDGRPFPEAECDLIQALRAGTALRHRETVFFRRDGTPIDVVSSNAPIIEDGVACGAVLTVIDVTERKAAGARLRRSEERLALALNAAGMIGTWDWELATDTVYADANFARTYDVDPDRAATGTPIRDYLRNFHSDDLPVFQAELDRVLSGSGADGDDFACEYRVLQADGGHRWLLARGRLVRSPDGTPLRLPGASIDITERKRAEERQAALVELGDRLRDLQDATAIAFTAAEITGRTLGLTRVAYGAVDASAEHLDITRDWSRPDVVGREGRYRFADYGTYLPELQEGRHVVIGDVTTDPRTRTHAEVFRALGVRSMINIPLMERGRMVAVFCMQDDRVRAWTPDIIDFARNVVDRTRVALARLRAEEEQELLNRELSHRMKNLLAMVQSISTQTMRTATDVETAKEVLAGRLIALGQAHDLLMGGALGSTLIGPVVRGALRLHEDRPGRFRLDGPDLEIGAKPALSLALMLHELATNAAKYGALSCETGHVAIRWAVEEREDEAHLTFSWTEVGGPAVTAPTRKGFGSRFIERGLAGQVGGTIALAYPSTGVTCGIVAPLTAFQADG